MNAKILRLFFLLLISIGITIPTLAAPSSDQKKQGEKRNVENRQLGLHLSADAFGYIYPIFVKDKYYSTELSATLNINNRFLPTVEVGLGHTNMVSQLYEIGYSTRAPYYRVGMDYNMQYKNKKPGYIYLGARVGYTAFNYSVEAAPLVDPVWGDEVPIHFSHVPCQAVWTEAVGGLRAEIVRNIYMGWSLRFKYPIYRGPIANGGPWYIPGFGTGSKGILGATYTIGYYFNFTKKK